MKPKKASNKIISVLLALIMLIGMLPLSIIPTQDSSYAGLAKSIDMCQFKAVNGTDALKLTNGELYVLRLTIYEVWRGYTKQMSITRTAEMNFGAAPDLSGLDFGISAQQDRSGTTFSVNITPSETNGVLPNSSAGNVIMEECMYSSTFDTVSFGNLPTGKQTIVARLQGNDAFGFKQAFTFVGKDYGSTHKITATVDRTEWKTQRQTPLPYQLCRTSTVRLTHSTHLR